MVTVYGMGMPSALGMICQFGSKLVGESSTKMISSSMVSCVSPPAVTIGVVTLALATDEMPDITTEKKDFEYEIGATVVSIRPSAGCSGGTTQFITVFGQHFERTEMLSCRFGLNQTALGIYLSSSMVLCRVPAKSAGTVSVSVSNNGVESGQGSAWYDFACTHTIHMITPSMGPTEGGTIVQLTTTGRLEFLTARCSFDGVLVPAMRTKTNSKAA